MTNIYKRLLTMPALAALEALHRERPTTGTTPDDDLDVLAGLVVASRARRILQFGTFLGGSAIVLADLAAQNGEGAQLVSIDPDPNMNACAREYVTRAGLGGMFETADAHSLDPALLKRLAEAEWDVIYLDTTHQYQQTREEIAAIAPLCGPATLFLFHDASAFAAETLDTGRQGGVRRAIREYCLQHPRWQWFVFERPAFGQYGIGMMQKRAA